MNQYLGTLLVCTMLTTYIGCHKEDAAITPGASKEISPIKVMFHGPEFLVKPRNEQSLKEIRTVIEPLRFRTLQINELIRALDGTLCVRDTNLERNITTELRDAMFCKRDFTLTEIQRLTPAEMDARFGISLTPMRQDAIDMWQIWNGRSGKKLRLYQVIVQSTPGGGTGFVAINTGEPNP
jgi:hypothetical protein